MPESSNRFARASTRLGITGNAKRITFPAPITAALGWKHGDELMCVADDGALRVVTLERYLREYSQAARAAAAEPVDDGART